jgi:hypothetical protein
MKSIAVVIVSWPEFEQKACEIAAEIGPQADTLLVLHDGPRGQSAGNAGDWIQFPSGSYFGPKFEWAIKNINADVLLLIVADTWSENWGGLVERCCSSFSSDADIAVWAPVIDETWWNTEKILINTEIRDDGLQDVIAVDSIVWAISSPIMAEMKKLDYSDSRFGWGIEVTCAAIARCSGKLVVRDTQLEVAHRRGTTYSTEVANEEGQEFYRQLDPAHQAMAAVIEEFALLKTVSTPKTLSRSVRRGWGYLRDLAYRLVVKRFFSRRK